MELLNPELKVNSQTKGPSDIRIFLIVSAVAIVAETIGQLNSLMIGNTSMKMVVLQVFI